MADAQPTFQPENEHPVTTIGLGGEDVQHQTLNGSQVVGMPNPPTMDGDHSMQNLGENVAELEQNLLFEQEQLLAMRRKKEMAEYKQQKEMEALADQQRIAQLEQQLAGLQQQLATSQAPPVRAVDSTSQVTVQADINPRLTVTPVSTAIAPQFHFGGEIPRNRTFHFGVRASTVGSTVPTTTSSIEDTVGPPSTRVSAYTRARSGTAADNFVVEERPTLENLLMFVRQQSMATDRLANQLVDRMSKMELSIQQMGGQVQGPARPVSSDKVRPVKTAVRFQPDPILDTSVSHARASTPDVQFLGQYTPSSSVAVQSQPLEPATPYRQQSENMFSGHFSTNIRPRTASAVTISTPSQVLTSTQQLLPQQAVQFRQQKPQMTSTQAYYGAATNRYNPPIQPENFEYTRQFGNPSAQQSYLVREAPTCLDEQNLGTGFQFQRPKQSTRLLPSSASQVFTEYSQQSQHPSLMVPTHLLPAAIYCSEALQIATADNMVKKAFAKDPPAKFRETKTPGAWETFIKNFEMYAAGYSCLHKDELTINLLLKCLEGAPRQSVENMRKSHPNISYLQVKHRLAHQYDPKVDPMLIRHKLPDVKLDPGETLNAFAERCTKLIKDAYPDDPWKTKEERAADLYLRSVPDKWRQAIRKRSTEHTITSYLEITTQCEKEDRYKRETATDKPFPSKKGSNIKQLDTAQDDSHGVFAVNPLGRGRASAFTQYQAKGASGENKGRNPAFGPYRGKNSFRVRGRLRSSGRGRRTYQGSGNRGYSSYEKRDVEKDVRIPPKSTGFGGECFNCHAKGHKAVDCDKPRKEKPSGRFDQNQQQKVQSFGKKSPNAESKKVDVDPSSGSSDTESDDGNSSQIENSSHTQEPPLANWTESPSNNSDFQTVEESQFSRFLSPCKSVNILDTEDDANEHPNTIGKSIVYPVNLSGISVKEAILDTGAKVTIVSADLVNRLLAKHGEAWAEGRFARFKGAVVVFGGAKFPDIYMTVDLEVTVDDSTAIIACLIDEAPIADSDCLMGENALSCLGFTFLSPAGVPLLRDMKGQTRMKLQPASIGASKGELAEVSCYRLTATSDVTLHGEEMRRVAVRTPEIQQGVPEGKYVFVPADSLEEKGLAMESAIFQVKGDSSMALPVANRWVCNHKLMSGTEIGTLVEYSKEAFENMPVYEETARVRKIVESYPMSQERERELRELLNPEEWSLLDVDRDKILDVLLQQHEMFAVTEQELGEAEDVKLEIDTGDHKPIAFKSRRVPFSQYEALGEKIRQLLAAGVVEEAKGSWSFPIVLVRKKDSGDLRLCVDYTALNEITKKDVYPLPHCMSLLEAAGRVGPKFFTTLDLRSGYHQITVDEASKEKTTFICPYGLFQYRKMPFGLTNAPALFQRVVDKIFRGIQMKFGPGKVAIYIDDILITTATLEEHVEVLSEVLDRLRAAGLKLHPKKCKFFRKSVCFLGFVLSAEGMHADESKVSAVTKFETPKTLTQLKSFLGLCSYYRRFVPNFSSVAAPLNAMLKGPEPKVEWTESAEIAFNLLKQLMTSAPVLRFPDWDKDFIIETDASNLGLGAVLEQIDDSVGKVFPVAYASRSLRGAEVNYWIGDLEFLAIYYALQAFRPIIFMKPVTVITDNTNVVSWTNKSEEQLSRQQLRWKMYIKDSQCRVIYRRGEDNAVADALSRNPLKDPEASVKLLNAGIGPGEFDTQWLQKVKIAQRGDPRIQEIIDYLVENKLPSSKKRRHFLKTRKSNFFLVNGILFYLDDRPENQTYYRIYVPESERKALFWDLHASPSAGHLSSYQTLLAKFQQFYYWPAMQRSIKHYLRSCLVCAARSGQQRPKMPPLLPLETPQYPFQSVGADILKLPLTLKGNRYVLVVTDLFSGFSLAAAMLDMTAETTMKKWLELVVPFGVPQKVTTDQGTQFTSDLARLVCDALKVEQVFTTTFHPQANGAAERFNKTLCNMLAKVCNKKGSDWDEMLMYVVFAYNSSTNHRTKISPFETVFGRKPTFPSSTVMSYPVLFYNLDPDDFKVNFPKRLQVAWKLVQEASEESKKTMKEQYDKRASVDIDYQVGDSVLVRAREKEVHKLAKSFIGPGTIEWIGRNNARVKFPAGMKPQYRTVSLDKLSKAHPELEGRFYDGDGRRRIPEPEILEDSVDDNASQLDKVDGELQYENEEKREVLVESVDDDSVVSDIVGNKDCDTVGQATVVSSKQQTTKTQRNTPQQFPAGQETQKSALKQPTELTRGAGSPYDLRPRIKKAKHKNDIFTVNCKYLSVLDNQRFEIGNSTNLVMSKERVRNPSHIPIPLTGGNATLPSNPRQSSTDSKSTVLSYAQLCNGQYGWLENCDYSVDGYAGSRALRRIRCVFNSKMQRTVKEVEFGNVAIEQYKQPPMILQELDVNLRTNIIRYRYIQEADGVPRGEPQMLPPPRQKRRQEHIRGSRHHSHDSRHSTSARSGYETTASQPQSSRQGTRQRGSELPSRRERSRSRERVPTSGNRSPSKAKRPRSPAIRASRQKSPIRVVIRSPSLDTEFRENVARDPYVLQLHAGADSSPVAAVRQLSVETAQVEHERGKGEKNASEAKLKTDFDKALLESAAKRRKVKSRETSAKVPSEKAVRPAQSEVSAVEIVPTIAPFQSPTTVQFDYQLPLDHEVLSTGTAMLQKTRAEARTGRIARLPVEDRPPGMPQRPAREIQKMLTEGREKARKVAEIGLAQLQRKMMTYEQHGPPPMQVDEAIRCEVPDNCLTQVEELEDSSFAANEDQEMAEMWVRTFDDTQHVRMVEMTEEEFYLPTAIPENIYQPKKVVSCFHLVRGRTN